MSFLKVAKQKENCILNVNKKLFVCVQCFFFVILFIFWFWLMNQFPNAIITYKRKSKNM